MIGLIIDVCRCCGLDKDLCARVAPETYEIEVMPNQEEVVKEDARRLAAGA